MKKLLIIIILTLLLICLFAGCSSEQVLTITTGGTGGTYYPIGGAIVNVLDNNIDNLTVTAQAGNASVANCTLIKESKTQMALVQNNVAYWAYAGEQTFEGDPVKKLRGIASLYPEAIQLIALLESGIESVEDLKGKKVCVGEQGSGVYADVTNILTAHNMTIDDFDAEFLSFSESSEKLKDKTIDAAFLTAGYPTSAVVDVASSANMVLVPIEEDKVNKMIKTSPYYALAVIPAGTYKGVDDDVLTATTMAMWVCTSKLDEGLVYKMTKAIWEDQDIITNAHEKGKMVTLETALDGMGIPLHPGAEKYYQENK